MTDPYEKLLEQHGEIVDQFFACILADPYILLETKITVEMIDYAFMSPAAEVFKIIQRQLAAKTKPDILTIHDEINKMDKGLSARVPRMKDIVLRASSTLVSEKHWKMYEGNFLEYWGKKKVLEGCKRTIDQIGPSTTLEDLSGALEGIVSEVNLIETGYKIESISEIVPRVIEKIEERFKAKGDLTGITTGFPELDRMTFGMQPGTLWIIGGRPSQGKSAIGSQIQRSVVLKTPNPAGVISIESSNSEIGMRHMSSLTRISQSKINTGFLTASDFSTIHDEAGRLYGLQDKLVYYDKPAIEIKELAAVARRMVKRYAIKVLFVDYLQLIQVRGSRNRFEAVAEASISLKAIARDLQITVLALAQLGRDADDGRPGMKDFQYSSQIEQDADVALLLWHRKIDEKNTESFIIVEKARDGITGDIPVKFDKPILTFFEVEKNTH